MSHKAKIPPSKTHGAVGNRASEDAPKNGKQEMTWKWWHSGFHGFQWHHRLLVEYDPHPLIRTMLPQASAIRHGWTRL